MEPVKEEETKGLPVAATSHMPMPMPVPQKRARYRIVKVRCLYYCQVKILWCWWWVKNDRRSVSFFFDAEGCVTDNTPEGAHVDISIFRKQHEKPAIEVVREYE